MSQSSSTTLDDRTETIAHSIPYVQRSARSKTAIIQKVEAGSESQAKAYCRQLSEDVKLLSTVRHDQIEHIRGCRAVEANIFIEKDAVVGVSYREIVSAQGRLTEADTIDFLQQVLSLLIPMHRNGLSHRNLSPDSIYLRSEDELPVITQFRFLQDIFIEFGEPCAEILQDKAFQLTGVAVPRGVSEDLYCLTLTAIMLLTGRPLEALFDRPTQSWCWKDYQQVSDDFGRILDQMLSFDMRDWFRSAEEILFAIDLATFVASPSPSAVSSMQTSKLAEDQDWRATISRTEIAASQPLKIGTRHYRYHRYEQWFVTLGFIACIAALVLGGVAMLNRVENRLMLSAPASEADRY